MGQPVDKPFVVRNHDNAVDALLDLDNSINTNEGSEPPPAWIAATMLIIMPDGRRLGFDDVYTETFGAYPVRQDNRENLYPKLRKAALKKGKKR